MKISFEQNDRIRQNINAEDSALILLRYYISYKGMYNLFLHCDLDGNRTHIKGTGILHFIH